MSCHSSMSPHTRCAVCASYSRLFCFSSSQSGGFLVNRVQAQEGQGSYTQTPIKHVIVIIGENRSFDHVFATYVPKNGQTVWNLLSEGIVNADGSPGPNFYKAEQQAATDSVRRCIPVEPAEGSFPE